jgi:hypothetical protein
MRMVSNLLSLKITTPHQSAASNKKYTQLEFRRHIRMVERIQEAN